MKNIYTLLNEKGLVTYIRLISLILFVIMIFKVKWMIHWQENT